MNEAARLLSLSIAMLIGSFLAGSIPLTISLSERNLRLVSIVGAGLLVGTALAVIIPEGVHSLYENADLGHDHSHHQHHVSKRSLIDVTGPMIEETVKAQEAHIDSKDSPSLELHTVIGISLCVGFIFMLLVDQISGGHSHGSSESESSRRHKKSWTATVGLIVHAAADGIALGAAATTSRTDVEMIVFFAIMLHKAPAAFGLATFLLQESYDRNSIRKHLLLFSTAAPACALLTFYGLSQGSKEALSNINATGITMLVSAGTFLYVATVHILPEVGSLSSSPQSIEAGQSIGQDSADCAGHKTLSRMDLALLIIGILIPMALGATHRH